jgi:dienelactone hydrolase
MKNKNLLFLLLALVSFSLLKAQDPNVCLKINEATIRQFRSGATDSVYSYFNEDMKSRLKPDDLKTIWSKLADGFGAFTGTGTPTGTQFQDYYQIETQLQFENKNLRYRLAFDKDNKISGMYFVPYRTRRKPNIQLTNNEKLQEFPIMVQSAGVKLPGVLCIPKGVKNFPIVVFVHGSGANDRDETIGPNKPFRDLAHGLAERGIASIRYDKRSLVAPQSLKNLNGQSMFDVLVVNDALAAVALARTIDNVNPQAVFVLGHSLGAYLAPRIAERDVNIAGIIMMAANARPLEDLVYEQYKYIYNKDGLSKAEKQDLHQIRKRVKHVKHLESYLKKTDNPDLPITNNVDFWKAVNNYNQINTAKEIKQPVMLMQGLRDYQVPPREFKIWQHKLHAKKNVTFKSYAKLNHLFLEGEGKSYPDEYEKEGTIPDYVISDIAIWIKSIR